ncbi:hypothetical protein KY290_027465 [Solanum tuberosum]|uniref:Uncharacterized protein n=1 Tax=Solanum tuberosum TaxID=4113 RepID=A0ABQ7UF57_SOLTU|nr:hypothetical protein KY285_026394 [Solanum tuberosum]KAH0748233.1 hypothetical protein KY290_027465 [Solanum tuberosum]
MEADKMDKSKGDQGKQENKTNPLIGEGKQAVIQSNEKVQIQQEKEQQEQEDQWKTQRRKQHKNQEQANAKTEWRPRAPQHKESKEQVPQQPPQIGTIHIVPTQNIYSDLEMQEQPSTDEAGKDINNKTVEQEDQANIWRDGWRDGGIKEKPTNLQDGVTKGRDMTHVLHEGEYPDHPRDCRAPATPQNRKTQAQHQQADDQLIQGINNGDQDAGTSNQGQLQHGIDGKHNNNIQQEMERTNCQTPQNIKNTGEATDKPPNNKSQARLSKKRRHAIKKRQQRERGSEIGQQGQNKIKEEFDEYGVDISEDEYDQDTQSIDDNEDEEEGINNHLIKAFGSIFHTENEEKVKEVTGKQGLSPRGRKDTRQIMKSNSKSTTISRPNTRSKRRGL